MNSKEAATKPAKDQNDVELGLTRIKQWYIPANAESYLALKRAGVALNRIHQDFLPTLKLLTQKHGLRFKNVKFKEEILEPFLDKVGKSWNKKAYCGCTIAARTMVFESLKTEGFAIAKDTIPKLEKVLTDFFSRWGYRWTFDYSELRGKCKLAVEYWFDPERQPIIVLAGEPQDLPKVQFRLGNLRLSFMFDDPKGKIKVHLRPGSSEGSVDKTVSIGQVHTLIEIRQGGVFAPLHSSKCTYGELSSVLPLVEALMRVPNHYENNFEESPD